MSLDKFAIVIGADGSIKRNDYETLARKLFDAMQAMENKDDSFTSVWDRDEKNLHHSVDGDIHWRVFAQFLMIELQKDAPPHVEKPQP